MLVDTETQEIIRRGNVGLGELRGFAERKGMRGLLADGVAKILAGTTTAAEVAAVASSIAAAAPARSDA
jgi:type II secretory ATPase GspE/PulE/Tfp pilus assembly ATPase PilB-like protein